MNKFRYSLKSFFLFVACLSLVLVVTLAVADRDGLHFEWTITGNGDQEVHVLAGRFVDRWGIRDDRLAFVILTFQPDTGSLPGIADSRPVLAMPGGDEVDLLERGRLLEIHGSTIQPFEGRVTWFQWKEFETKQHGSFRMMDLLKAVESDEH